MVDKHPNNLRTTVENDANKAVDALIELVEIEIASVIVEHTRFLKVDEIYVSENNQIV